MIPSDNEFENNEVGKISNTTDPAIDGTRVKIVGVFADFTPLYRIYAIEREDGLLWRNGYKVFGLTSRCIEKD